MTVVWANRLTPPTDLNSSAGTSSSCKEETEPIEDENEQSGGTSVVSLKRKLAGYRAKAKKQKLSADSISSHSAQVSDASARYELDLYLDMLLDLEDNWLDAVKFWKSHQKSMPRLHRLSQYVFSVPATSGPVERVFSHGGYFMRQHRATLSTDNLCSIIFLKCNRLNK